MTTHTEPGHPERPWVTNSAPVMAYDYVPDGEPIWPCYDCYPWHIEVVTTDPEHPVLVRVWHAIGCPVLSESDRNGGSDGTH